MMNRKLLALATAASSLVMATQANAALVITVTAPSGTFTSNNVVCAGSPCLFSESGTFAAPAGYSLVGGTITSGPATGVGDPNDITFGTTTVGSPMTVTLNGTAFTLTSTGIFDTGTLGFISLLPTNTLSINGRAGATGQGSYSGTLQFANRAVPEPAIWAMMLLGFGMIGFAMRRRPKFSTRVNFAMS
ncbi:MAG: FxDxF family PEP-CTERM protein [Novosphingobium sp.]